MMSITVHLGLDDVELVLGSTAEDLHLILANLLDQCLFKRKVLKTYFFKRIVLKTYFGGAIICCALSQLLKQKLYLKVPRHLFRVGKHGHGVFVTLAAQNLKKVC